MSKDKDKAVSNEQAETLNALEVSCGALADSYKKLATESDSAFTVLCKALEIEKEEHNYNKKDLKAWMIEHDFDRREQSAVTRILYEASKETKEKFFNGTVGKNVALELIANEQKGVTEEEAVEDKTFKAVKQLGDKIGIQLYKGELSCEVVEVVEAFKEAIDQKIARSNAADRRKTDTAVKKEEAVA